MESKALSTVREIISGISGTKADYADVYIQSGVSHSVLFDNMRMDTLSSSRGDGLGVRIVKGEDTTYAHTPGTTAIAAAYALSEASDLSGIAISLPDGGEDPLLEYNPTLRVIESDFLGDIDAKLRKECKFLRQASFRYRTSSKLAVVVRGDGSISSEVRSYTTFAAQVVVEKDGLLQSGYEVRSLMVEPGDFWDLCAHKGAEDIAFEALRRGVLMLESIPCPAGVMTVLMDGTAGGTMIHEACGHGLEADIIQKDYSVYRDRIGELVASPLVTITDDATLPGRNGSYKYDDEGTPAQRTVLVENGVLKSYMTDILSSRVGNLPLTGNGRRESYVHQPLPRMSNTFVAPGKSSREEMLAGIKSGLLVSKMGGGEVNPTSGDYVFHVSEGYIIKDGKVSSPVRGAMLTGNGPETLKNVIAVGGDLVLEPGTCGKSGQGVPVTDGQPTLLIRDIVVGGCDTGDVG